MKAFRARPVIGAGRAPAPPPKLAADHLEDGLQRPRQPRLHHRLTAPSAFPDCEFSEGPTCGDLEGRVLGERHLPFLSEALPAVFDRVIREPRISSDGKWLARLHELWGEAGTRGLAQRPRAQKHTEAAEARRIQLDEEQLQILDFTDETSRVHVKGGAGSGKTVVARELCRRRAAAGQRVQYFCFTDALGLAVARDLQGGEAGDRMAAAPIRRYAAELLKKAGRPIKPDDPAFWESACLEAAASGLAHIAELPDLLVIDEAQDLGEADWTFVEELSQGRDLWIFSDERQAYWNERQIPDAIARTLATVNLRRQHRNPAPIWNFAARYGEAPSDADHPAAKAADLPPGAPVRLVVAEKAKLEAKLAHELTELRRGGARPADIAVLTLAGQKPSAIWGKSKLGPHPVALADADGAHDSIICDTFLRFKGLERPYVILTELVPGHLSRYESRMHIAATRATVGLTIVCSPEAVERDPRLRAFHGNC